MLEKLVDELFKAVDIADWERMSAIFCEDVIYERPGYAPIMGIGQLLHFYKHVRIIANGKHLLDHIIVNEECGSCWGRFIGYDKEQEPIDELFSDVYTFENGKIKQRRSYFFRPAI